MNISKTLPIALVALGMAGSASAQQVVNITGATAFREAAHQAIIASLGGAATVKYGYTGTNVNNASSAIFRGTVSGDDVVVRTTWSGAVGGIKSVVNQDSVTYYNTSATTLAAIAVGGTPSLAGVDSSTTANRICFSDNYQVNTPFESVFLNGGPVGVIAFVPCTNDVTEVVGNDPATANSLNTRALLRLQETGSVPLQLITNDVADAGITCYWTGRRDTSGTRAIYLAESGRGASKTVNQWRIEPNDNVADIAATNLRNWPTGDTANSSTVWGPDTVGNGGYDSGGRLANLLSRTTDSVNIVNAAGTTTATGQNAVLITVISAADANDIQVAGGKVLAYNGVYIEPVALPTGLSEIDKDKIRKGQYTLWSYEHLLYRDEVFDDEVEFALVGLLETNVPNAIGGNGVKLTEMKVSRTEDGGKFVTVSVP